MALAIIGPSGFSDLSCVRPQSVAYAAVWVARYADLAPFHLQSIEQQQSACQWSSATDQDFQGFGGLNCADNAGERRKYAHDGAAYFLDILAFGE